MTDIFGSSFNKDTFTNFVDEFLPDFERDEHPVDTTGILKKVNQIGKSDACNLSVFEVSIDETDAEKRIAITQNAFRMLRRHRIRNALIAFHYQSDNWRLSLLTSTLEIKDGKIVSKSSNPRRYSYLLGADAKANTPRKFLMKQGRVSSIKDLQKRFSVDVVNEEFYNSVAECFMELVGGERGEGKNKQTYTAKLKLPSLDKNEMQEFSVRLIGRIMFCWFLKEKKSPNGKPLMSSELLSLDAVSKNSDYYHNILEPLFFGCLNTRINKRVDDLKEEPFNQIPYLNGGLFSPQSTDYYNQNDFNGRGTPGLVNVPDEWFVKLFNILNQYNFTVDENTSFDIDLSIDPEMLGRIFENLLAEINPETGKTARKATGSFYTPREIVDYMVDNSLLSFLSNKTQIEDRKLRALISYGKEDDEEAPLNSSDQEKVIDALTELTILDPACGSGAFPIGILQKVFYILQQVDLTGKLWYEKQLENIPSEELKKDLKSKFENGNYDYIRKLGIIRQSIFGVDIQTIATEIAKLRCFLTLIIEEEVNDTEENRGIHPLPNLDFKFVSANSLVFLSTNIGMNMFDDDRQVSALKKIRNEYFTADEMERMLLRARFAELQTDMLKTRINSNGATSDKYNALAEWKPFDSNSVPWFDSGWMFGVNSFDIVIGNPPYGAKISDNEKAYYRKNYTAAKTGNGLKGSTDTFAIFIDRGLGLVKNGGVLSYIVPMAVTSSDAMTSLHAEIERSCKTIRISSYSNRPKQIFDKACVRTSIIFLSKTNTPTEHVYTTRLIRRGGDMSIQELIDNLQFIDSYKYKMFGRYPKISNSAELKILSGLFSTNSRVKDYASLFDNADKFYYRAAGGRYFNVVTTYPTNTSAEKPYPAKYADIIAACLSTSLFWFYQQTYTDGLNLKSYEIDNFPLPKLGEISEEKLVAIRALYKEYLDDIERNANVRTSSGNSTYNVSVFKEYKIVKSRDLINKLDNMICPLYGLDKDSIEYIKNYELNFRLSGEE